MAFVGRQKELDELAAAIGRSFDRSAGRAFFIEGPAGAGKTTLVTELLTRITAARPDVAIARGRCPQTFGSADPYIPFIDALRDLGDSSTAGYIAEGRLSGLLTELAPYWLNVVPFVGGLLSAAFATATEVRARQSGAPSREALFVQFGDVVNRLAREHPLILFLDDLHWADQSSVALLDYLARGIAKLPAVIVSTMRAREVEIDRPELMSTILELERESIAYRTHVADLSAEDLTALLAAEFGGDVSEPLERWLIRTGGGNPLFVLELVRLLKQSGGALESQGEWHLTELAHGIGVPRSAEAVIEKRIQRLDAEQVKLLQYASIAGQEFDSAVLSKLLDRDELDVLDALDPLDTRFGLVEFTGEMELPDQDVSSTLRFRHALVQTVLYGQVMGKRRVLLHRKAGEILEAMFGPAPDTLAGRLARHFHEGRVGERAHRYARIAAESAARVFAHWEAIEFLQIALEDTPDEARAAEVRERMGDIYGVVGRYEQAIASYREALDAGGADANVLRLERKTAVLERKAALVPAPELYRRVRTLLERAADNPFERCHLFMELARFPESYEEVDAAAEAVELAESLGDELLLAHALEQLAVARIFFHGRTTDAFPVLDRALDIARRLDDPFRIANYKAVAGVAHAKLGAYREALADFKDMLRMCERIGDPNGIGGACDNLGALRLRLGQYEEAREVFERARAIHERRDRVNVVEALFGLAEVARLTDDLVAARERYDELLECALEFHQWKAEAVANAGLGLVVLEAHGVEAAAKFADRADEIVAEHDFWFEDRDLVELFRARFDAKVGRRDAALERLERSAKETASRDVFLWARTELERARMLAESNPEAALEIAEGIAAATAEIQSPPLREEIAALLRIGAAARASA